MVVVVAEKPSVARDIARVLGARERSDGALRGAGYVITWAIGHLVALAQPEEMEASWKGWRFESLPMLPQHWQLSVIEQTRAQFEIVKRLLLDRDTTEIVCATDAGREGELIFRYIAELAGTTKPVKRLWVSSLTDEAIRAGFRRLKDAAAYDPLAAAARGRSRADWLVGMNLSRAYTLMTQHERGRGVLSVGRVQTPTLAIIAERDRAIAAFVPEPYHEVALELAAEPKGTAPTAATFEARYVRTHEQHEPARLDARSDEAAQLCARALRGHASVHAVEREEKRARPQLLYDLTELQRHGNRLFGFSASHTLALAQRLYEEHKLISYPRTDSRHLTVEVARELPAILDAVAGPYRELLEHGSLQKPLAARFVDDAQVRDHHAIIPTGKPSRLATNSDELKLYDLIVRRLLAAYQSDYAWAVTTVRVEVASDAQIDRYFAAGTTVLEHGHRRLDVKTRRQPSEELTLPVLSVGDTVHVHDARIDEKRTRPPPHYTEASLLTAMETAGRALDDKELSEAMRERGLGTPATRAAVIETLLARGFIERDDKTLLSTPAGQALIDAVHPLVKSAAMTGEWEHKLREIERGRGQLDVFMAGIEAFVREVIGSLGGPSRGPRTHAPALERAHVHETARPAQDSHAPGRSVSPRDGATASLPSGTPSSEPRVPTTDLEAVLKARFGFSEFRPHQREVCEQLVQGRDVLLVMPTGAGKSLCYQLPGLARAGTTLVISPLIALIEDQVGKLCAAGIRAERIHSGLGREAARETCRSYLRGELDFLFIAPERLRVPGFTELLERRPPTLIAIDEAHCISQWGHDFRPDYRMLRERLPRRGAGPIVALTATATAAVQRDIVEQLAVPDAVRSIHGFRRDNLGIHVVEAQPRLRIDMARSVLEQPGRTPAILYAPTRSGADQAASELATGFRSAAYHAGMDAGARERVQSAFLSGQLDVVVATIAFGMGVDKADVRTVVHLSSSASVEAYYQEIGRAGRDGAYSLALLLCSFADRRTHEFFFERDYPHASELERVYEKLGQSPVSKLSLARTLKLEEPALDAILDKLWAHGGARIDQDGGASQGSADFRRTYPKHRATRAAQLAHMARYLQTQDCRMLALVSHFGDTDDSGVPCGLCDRCRPEEAAFASAPSARSSSERALGHAASEKPSLAKPAPKKPVTRPRTAKVPTRARAAPRKRTRDKR
ncbi:MAG: topoisomerase [Myxococcaceae bacterium]|nr:topoisomerase [Myxococcaceae bacterium]